MTTVSARKGRWSTACAFLAIVVAGACSPLCPEGVFEGSLVVEDDSYYTSGFWGRDWLGDVGDNWRIQECRAIAGGLTFNGNVSDFSDFDALEYVAGGVGFMERGYPEGNVNGLDRQVIDGFPSLERIEGSLISGPVIRGMASLEYAAAIRAPTSGLVSLREVPGSYLGAGAGGTNAHLPNLESVGGDFSPSGDLDQLLSLRFVGGMLEVRFRGDVNLSPPVLEEVGWRFSITQNEGITAISVPSLQRIGGRLSIFSNSGSGLQNASTVAREAFAHVEIGDGVFICGNQERDPCPYDPDCLDVYDEEYCCEPALTLDECIASRTLGGPP